MRSYMQRMYSCGSLVGDFEVQALVSAAFASGWWVHWLVRSAFSGADGIEVFLHFPAVLVAEAVLETAAAPPSVEDAIALEPARLAPARRPFRRRD
jgi:hypothetical protein